MYSIRINEPSGIRAPVPPQPSRLLDQRRRPTRDGGYTWKTEGSHAHRVGRFDRFHDKQHPAAISARHVEAYLRHPANARQCSSATQRAALNALMYPYVRQLAVTLNSQ